VYFLDEMQNLNLKKFFLYLLIASVAASALLGIGVILLGNFGDFEIRILMTTVTVTVTSILGLACGAFLETKRGEIVPLAGIVSAVLSGALWIVIIWANFSEGEFFIKFLASLTLLAVACSHLSLLSLARLDPKFGWSRTAAQISIWSLTAVLLILIWTKTDLDDNWLARLIGVLSIVIAALTVMTPVFHKLSGQKSETEAIDEEIERLKNRLEELEKRRAEASA
jgi:hypothetical protein